MEEVKFSIIGITPLLTHSTRGMVIQAERGPAKGKHVPTPEEEAELGTYIPDDGIGFGIPGIAIRNSLIKAGGQWQVPGQKMQKMGGRLAPSIVGPGIVLPLLSPKGERLEAYEIDVQRAKVQRNGVMRARPRFDQWRVDFVIDYDEELVPGGADIIGNILEDAGRRVGIGDYRPETKGMYGRFEVL